MMDYIDIDDERSNLGYKLQEIINALERIADRLEITAGERT